MISQAQTRILASTLAVLATLTTLAGAQDKPVSVKPVAETVRVNVVNVEVYVSDKKGRPLPDLTQTDFELFEDDKPVALTNFYAAHPIAPIATESVSQTPSVGSSPSPKNQELTMVIFLDNLNVTNLDRDLVLDDLTPILQTNLKKGDRVMVMSYDLSGRIRHTLTTNPAVIVPILEDMRQETTEGALLVTEKTRLYKELMEDSGRAGGLLLMKNMPDGLIRAKISNYIQQLHVSEVRLIETLTRLIDSLAGIPGHKMLLFISGGIPVDPGREINEMFPDFSGFTTTLEYNLNDRIAQVVRHANAGRVTFCTVNAKKFRGAESGHMAENKYSPEQDPETTTVMQNSRMETKDELNREASLISFARSTGGRYLQNTAKLKTNLVQTVEDRNAYYSLGYQGQHFSDGRYHKLDVKVKRPGVSVRFREGYLDKTPDQRLADVTTAVLLMDGGDNPLAIQVEAGEPVKKGNVYTVPITITIPGEKLTFVPGDTFNEGRVNIGVLVGNAKGYRSEITRSLFRLQIPNENIAATREKNASFTLTLEVRPGEQKLAVVARDEIGQIDSAAIIDLDIGK